MIKFAVSRPPVRREGIKKGLELLNWSKDPMLNGYGLKIDPEMLKTNARILDPPEVLFKGGIAKPLLSSRWDLRGKVFYLPNTTPLKSWGICVLGQGKDVRPAVSADQVEQFKKNFMNLYRGHGGKIENANPYEMCLFPEFEATHIEAKSRRRSVVSCEIQYSRH